MMPFSRVERTVDRPVYVIGAGTSLIGFDFTRLEGLGYRLGVNKVPWTLTECEGVFSLDQHFIRRHRDDIQDFVSRGGEAYLAVPPNEQQHRPIEGATYLVRRRNPGLSDNPADVYGMNSGFGALGVAYLMDAPTIALLGLDMQYGKDGRTHAHDGYSWHSKANHRFMDHWSKHFDRAARQCETKGIEVINYVGSPKSKIKAFPTAPLEEL